ncbi:MULTISPECIES: SAM-dependent chlorinase/fluorinase [unclassified Leptolyngbya]|uniref:SAM hydrolase/SAM-dependent halogenase family protein n=1 Tax=unclassified Leptolyngbya TaxID=2650499 RepID=UPI00321FBD24
MRRGGSRLLTLLTDFGLKDAYVGVMKGVIADINPTVQVVDLTHQIPPQDIAAGRFNLMNAVPFFPAGTVHVAVVDPGVGGRRRAIALQTTRNFLVGPDNGLFSGVLEQEPIVAAVELTNLFYWRTPDPSATFHGRDIFAAVGAHLARGVPLENLGEAIAPASLIRLPIPPCEQEGNGLVGCIQYIDGFGNLITNIPAQLVMNPTWVLQIHNHQLPRSTAYSAVPAGNLVALVGSHGWVEVAVNAGNAQEQLGVAVGDPVQLQFG